MKTKKIFIAICIGFFLASAGYGASSTAPKKKKILVVSSYHKEYIWTRETNEGFCAAMLKFGYFDNKDQIATYTKNNYVETSKVIIKKLWMDTKRQSRKSVMDEMSMKIYKIAKNFNPDLIFLGDDNATNYIGSKFLDTQIPIVFWGVNSTPVKYGLVDTIERPGHNVTGVYQPGFFIESLKLLKQIVPTVKTFAVISDDSKTGKANYKHVTFLAQKGVLPLKLVEVVATNDFELWKKKALELQKNVDAFFIGHYASFKDKNGNYVKPEEAVKWYITHINIPEAMTERQFVKQGILCTADDSGFKQGFEAVVIAHDILARGANPATYAPRAPKRGALIVNKQRARMLGITLTEKMGIEGYIEEAEALRKTQR